MELYDSILAGWPGEYQTCSIPTRHGETFVIAAGDPAAPPLVLLHGSVSNALSWIGEVPVYSRSFRVYAVDLPGEPGRSSHNRPPWIGPAFAEWLHDVLDGLKIQRANLLGISQGGWTALKFATAYPERVEKLVLLTPGGIVPPRTSFLVKGIFYSFFGRWGAERINRIVFGDQPIHPEAVRVMNVLMTNFKPRIENQPMFTDTELACLTMPVLLVIGGKDALIPTEKTTERMQRLVRNLTVRLFPDAGHVLVNLAEEILPFLAQPCSIDVAL